MVFRECNNINHQQLNDVDTSLLACRDDDDEYGFDHPKWRCVHNWNVRLQCYTRCHIVRDRELDLSKRDSWNLFWGNIFWSCHFLNLYKKRKTKRQMNNSALH